MKKIKLIVILICLFLFTGCSNSNLKEISYKKYKEMLNNKETFILEIMRTDCSHCISFKPKLNNVAKKYDLTIYYINTDHLSKTNYDKLYSETGITGTPTVLFYNDGEELTKSSRIRGDNTEDKIISKLKANGFIK